MATVVNDLYKTFQQTRDLMTDHHYQQLFIDNIQDSVEEMSVEKVFVYLDKFVNGQTYKQAFKTVTNPFN